MKMDDFLQKLEKVVRIVLYGPAISQSDCKKAGPYQLPSIMIATMLGLVSFLTRSEILLHFSASSVNQ